MNRHERRKASKLDKSTSMQIYKPPSVAIQEMQRDLVEAIEETARINKEYLEDFETRATAFHDALRKVDRAIYGIKWLIVANGGDDTAKALGHCSDELIRASSAFKREAVEMEKSPFAVIDFDAVGDLATECLAMHTAANAYAGATAVARPALKRKIANAIGESEPIIAALYHSRRRRDDESRILAQMIADLRSSGKSWSEVIGHIQEHHPTIHQTYFTHPTMQGRINFAKSLVRE